MKTNEAALGADNRHELDWLTEKHRAPIVPVVQLEAESRWMHAEVLGTTRETFRL